MDCSASFSHDLFVNDSGVPITFVVPYFEGRDRLSSLIKLGGGTVSNVSRVNAIRLTTQRNGMHNSVHIGYINDCIKANQLLDVEEYRHKTPWKIISSPSIKLKSTRRKRKFYTPSEDEAIQSYIATTVNKQSQLRVSGNTIWKMMAEEKVTPHSWQSMKERYRKHIHSKMSAGDERSSESTTNSTNKNAEPDLSSNNSVYSTPSDMSDDEFDSQEDQMLLTTLREVENKNNHLTTYDIEMWQLIREKLGSERQAYDLQKHYFKDIVPKLNLESDERDDDVCSSIIDATTRPSVLLETNNNQQISEKPSSCGESEAEIECAPNNPSLVTRKRSALVFDNLMDSSPPSNYAWKLAIVTKNLKVLSYSKKKRNPELFVTPSFSEKRTTRSSLNAQSGISQCNKLHISTQTPESLNSISHANNHALNENSEELYRSSLSIVDTDTSEETPTPSVSSLPELPATSKDPLVYFSLWNEGIDRGSSRTPESSSSSTSTL